MRRALCCAALAWLVAGGAAQAATVSVSYDAPLRFGRFVVPTTGTRTVSPTGVVTDSGVFAIAGDPVAPAQFTITYDRGFESTTPLTVLMQLQITGEVANSGNVTGSISTFTTDLAGASPFFPGSFLSLTMTSCRSRRCAQTVRIGGSLNVTRNSGGAKLTVPILVTATLIAAF